MSQSPVCHPLRTNSRFGRTAAAIAFLLVVAACGQASDYSVDTTQAEISSSDDDSSEVSDQNTDAGDNDASSSESAANSDDSADSDSDSSDSDVSESSETNDDSEVGNSDEADDPDGDDETSGTVPVLVPRIINTFPHDPTAFTQGLEYLDGVLFESTGLYGESSRRRVGLANGVISSSLPLTDDLFGGGIALVGEGSLIQLTWKEGVAILADPLTLQEFDRFTYDGEGWGLCDDGERLVMSDGTSKLTFRDPMSFAAIGTVAVTRAGEPVERLNELECVDGFVWANVWLTNDIVQIDPSTGDVIAVIDASSLVPTGITDDENVLNGIAYNPVDDTFFITGKRWDVMYEVDFVAS